MIKAILKLSFVALAVNFIFQNWDAYGTGDVQIWMRWMTDSQKQGFVNGYIASISDYPPLSHAMLAIFGLFENSFDNHALVKISILFFLLLWISSCLQIGKHFKQPLLSCLLISLNPAIILNSVFLSYLDIYFAAALALAVFFLCTKNPSVFLSGVFLALSIFLKWQPLILLPIFLSWLAGNYFLNKNVKLPLHWIFGFLTPVVFIITAFKFHGVDSEIKNAFIRAMNHPAPTANALNFNWFITHFLQAQNPSQYGSLPSSGMVNPEHFLWLKNINLLLLCVPYSLLCTINLLEPSHKNLLSTLVLASLSYVFLSYGAHENHSFASVILASLFYLISGKNPESKKRSVILLIFSSLHVFVNLFIFYVPMGTAIKDSLDFNIATPLSVVFSLVYIFLLGLEINDKSISWQNFSQFKLRLTRR